MRTQVLLLTAVAVAAAVTGSMGGSTPHTAATPLCYAATVTTSAAGPTNVGPYCAPYPGSTDCRTDDVVAGSITLGYLVCLPGPIEGVSSRGA